MEEEEESEVRGVWWKFKIKKNLNAKMEKIESMCRNI